MRDIISNYRTSLCGVVSIAVGLYIGVTSGEWVVSAPMISSGIGLILASDGGRNR